MVTVADNPEISEDLKNDPQDIKDDPQDLMVSMADNPEIRDLNYYSDGYNSARIRRVVYEATK